MAFVHGKTFSVLFDEFDVSAFLNSADQAITVETAETTAFGSTAKSYIVGQRDSTVSLGGMWSGNTGDIDDVLSSALGGTVAAVSLIPQGANGLGNRAYVASAHESSYQVTGAVGDAVAISAELQVSGENTSSGFSGGAFNGVVLADLSAKSGTSNSLTVVDNGAATSNGLMANLHMTSIGASTTVTIFHSADNVTFVALVSFGTHTVPVGMSISTADGSTVNRYLRVSWSGSSGTRTFAVTAARK